MKKLLLLSALLIFAFGFGQEHKHPVKFKYELTNELSNSKLPYLKGYLSKINNYVVIELEGSQDENYIILEFDDGLLINQPKLNSKSN